MKSDIEVILEYLKGGSQGKLNLDTGANLSGADLSGANLCGVCLMDANLSGVNLSGANLSDAITNLC